MATFYIKAAGGTGSGADDANAWSLAHFNSQTLVGGNSYLFKRGDTFYGSITINANGSNPSKITFDYYGSGAKPVITGLTTINGWTDIGGGLYEKTLSSPPTTMLNMVLLDGVIQGYGRLPKKDLGEDSYYTISSHTTANTSWTRSHGTLTSSEIAAAPNCVGGEICQRSQKWVLDRATVTSQSSTVVGYTSHVSPRHPTITYEPVNNHGFFFQNHPNCCTEFGEWAYNQTTKKITMFFGGEDPTDYTIQVSTLDNLLIADDKDYVVLNNIEFNGANEALVKLTNGSTHFDFNSVNLYNAGHYSFFNQNNTGTHMTFDQCHVNGSNSNGLTVLSGPNWSYTNNLIENIGTIMGMGLSGDQQYVGVTTVGNDSLFEFNEVRYIGYIGVFFRPGDNITIQHNHIHHYLLVKDDGGAIYTFGAGGSNKLIHKNICHDGIGTSFGVGEVTNDIYPEGQVHGIYLDNDTENVTVTDNTSFRNGHSGMLFGNTNRANVATGNTLYDNKITQFKASGGTDYSDIVIQNNIFFAKQSGSLCMAHNYPLDDIQAMTCNSNKICRPIWEPNGVNSTGYSTAPLTWLNYHDGGVVLAESKFKSLDTWKTYSGQDAASTKTIVPITNESRVRFEYNPTNTPITVDLEEFYYLDLDGNIVSGSIEVAAYSSVILLKSIPPGVGTVIYGHRAVIL